MKDPIDIEKAISCLGNEDVFRKTACCFLKETDRMMEALAEAVASEDWALVKERAHCVKGGLVYLHAGPSADAAKELQSAADDGKDAVKTAYSRLHAEVEKLKKALSSEKTLSS